MSTLLSCSDSVRPIWDESNSALYSGEFPTSVSRDTSSQAVVVHLNVGELSRMKNDTPSFSPMALEHVAVMRWHFHVSSPHYAPFG